MVERFSLVGSGKCKEVLAAHPDYKVFWRAGFAYRGAEEVEDDKQTRKEYVFQERTTRDTTFEERMQRRYDWSAAIDIKVDNEKKEIHFNGFSEHDMF